MNKNLRFAMYLLTSIFVLGSVALANCWKDGPYMLCVSPPSPRICIDQGTGLAINCADLLDPEYLTIRFAVTAGPDEPGKTIAQPHFHGSILRTFRACPEDPNEGCKDLGEMAITCWGTKPYGNPCVGVIVEN